jgi:tight adherence protein B
MSNDTLLTLITIAGTFGVLAALWLAFMLIYGTRLRNRDRAIEERLGLIVATDSPRRVLRLWHDDHFEETVVGTGRPSRSMIARIKQLHEDAGIQTDPMAATAMVIGGALFVGVAIYMVIPNPIFAIVAPFFIVLAYFWILGFRVGKRSGIFDNQIVASLELIARSLRAGHPLLASFHLITEEVEEPMRGIFAEILQQQNMGVSLEEALQRVAAQSTSSDLKLFATAVSIQLRSGGNLADVMDRLSFVIRDRIRLGRRVKVLTAQTNLSKRILLGFPFVMFFIINIINPEYAAILTDTPTGNKLLVAGAVMMVFGSYVMNKLAVLKY